MGVHAEKCSRFNLMMDFVHTEGCLKHALLDQLVLVIIISLLLKIVINIGLNPSECELSPISTDIVPSQDLGQLWN